MAGVQTEAVSLACLTPGSFEAKLVCWVGSESKAMHLQNRVTPFGDIVAIPQRGMFTGNRGIIHDPRTKSLLSKRWTNKAWLICSCEYKGRRREIMGTQSWTELFFLDEAVALAAGHRPCFLCRRKAAEAFRAAWAKAKGGAEPTAGEMDTALHTERLISGRRRRHALRSNIVDLPDGAIVSLADEAFTIAKGKAFRWTENGYDQPQTNLHADGLLTPPSSLGALEAGYHPVVHPTIGAYRSNSRRE
jgi:hypothetical protein